jgi:hypothetical protein
MDMGREVRVIQVEEVRQVTPVEPITIVAEEEPAIAETN